MTILHFTNLNTTNDTPNQQNVVKNILRKRIYIGIMFAYANMVFWTLAAKAFMPMREGSYRFLP